MTQPSDEDVTRLLHEWRSGAPGAEDRLFDRVMPDLKRLAGYFLSHERANHTLTATALLSDLYLRLAGARAIDWQDRKHFFALAARGMRFILVDHARARAKADRVDIDPDLPNPDRHLDTVLAVDAAFDRLAQDHPDLAAVVALKFFLGMTDQEAAATLGWPLRTAQRRWHDARAWFYERLGDLPV